MISSQQSPPLVFSQGAIIAIVFPPHGAEVGPLIGGQPVVPLLIVEYLLGDDPHSCGAVHG